MNDWIRPFFDEDELLCDRFAPECRSVREVARDLPFAGQPGRAAALARWWSVPVGRAAWAAGDIRVTCLAECTIAPPAICLNAAGIRRLTSAVAVPGGEELGAWSSEQAIIEVVTAHELWHVILRRASGPRDEFAAHCFTRELLGMPFSPLLYAEFLRRLACGGRSGVRESKPCATTWA